jgi:uncharacterized membrane protein YGL010W
MDMSSLPSSALMIHFKDYEQYHRTYGNKVTHLIGIPAVLFSLLGLLSQVVLYSATPESAFRIDLGALLVVGGAIFSIRTDWKLAIPFILYIYLNYLISRHLNLSALAAIQVVGWVLQLWGHFFYEKKSPAFFTSISHLFVGPMWIFAWAIRYYKPPETKTA